MIDEIQLSYKVKNTNIDESLVPEEDKDMLFTTFYDVLNDLMVRSNLDIYVTGSNSKCYQRISSPILETVAQKLEYLLCPLKSFLIFWTRKTDAFEQYIMYGGMPLAVLEPDEHERASIFKDSSRMYI